MRRILQISVWVLGLWFTNTASAAELDEAVSAYNAGDYQTALRMFKTLAEQGYPSAQFNLGLIYRNGEGVLQDDKEAVKQYRLAGEQDIEEAQYNLGFIYSNGQGVLQDYKEAVKWYQMATEQGEVNAHYNLGLKYAKGEGVIEDLVYAHMWWNIAASLWIDRASENRKIASSKMTPSQIEKAQELARQCVKKDYKDC